MRPRLNPFALPSETTLRFVLLIVAVLGTSIFISNWLYFTLTNSRREVERIGVCLQAERTATQTTGDALFGGQILQACMAPGDHQKARWMLAGPAGALLLGGALYLGWPAAMRRRRQLRPLAPDVPQVADAVAALSREAGLRRAPEVLWNPMRSAGGAIAFGTP